MSALHIRTMTPDDLDFAAACTEAVGWGAQRGEFELFHAHDPQGCLVAEREGCSIGICVATPYDGQGFIGMLIVVPEARGRGVGRLLLERAIDYLDERGARVAGLDAVLAAVPLYERLGFRRQCRSLRFGGTIAGRRHSSVRPMAAADLDAVCALDRAAFGADRRFFLARRLARAPALCKVLERDGRIDGYLFGRPVEGGVSVGPWAARPELEQPARLLEALALESGEPRIGLGILESNEAALEAARSLGLTARRDSPWRMTRVWEDTCVSPDTRALSSRPEHTVALGASPLAYAIGSPAKG